MAITIVREFPYPAGNVRGLVRYNDATGDVTYDLEAINPDLPKDEGVFDGPNDGYADGDELVQSSCELNTDGEATGSEIQLLARDAYPYAQRLVVPNSPNCTQPAGCSLRLSVTYDTVNGFVVLLVEDAKTAAGAPGGTWESSPNNIQFYGGQTNFQAAPGASGYIYVRDAYGCRERVGYTMPAGSGGGPGGPGGGGGTTPPGEIIDQFTIGGETVYVYYDPTDRALAKDQGPGTTAILEPVTEAQRDRAEGDLISQRCEGFTQVRFYATLVAPFARLETTPNSTECDYVPPTALTLQATATDASAVGGNGSATATVAGGVYPVTVLIVETGDSEELAAPGATDFSLAPGTYTVRATDSTVPTAQVEEESVTIDPYVEPVSGCDDPDATNYNPDVTDPDNTTCRYAPRWVGAWARGGVQVPVTPLASEDGEPVPAYLTAELWAGYPNGHPLAASRPLAFVVSIRATVAPTGVATFDLAPFLRPLLGADTTGGVRRLDLNSPTAHTADLYVGWALYLGDEKRAHGYALNSALPEDVLEDYRLSHLPLAPWGGVVPTWPGFDFFFSVLDEDVTGRLGYVDHGYSSILPLSRRFALPCPVNPLPVAWLTPEGSWAYWVFQGRPEHGDQIGEGEAYTEGETEERRFSRRAPSYRTVSAWSGVFSSRALADGLRTLRRSPQVYYQPDPAGPWVPVTIEGGGAVPAYREGRNRYETTVTFTEALPVAVQGQ